MMLYFYAQCGYSKCKLTSEVYVLAVNEADAKARAKAFFEGGQSPAGREFFGEVVNVMALPVTPSQQKYIDQQNKKIAA